MSYLREMQRLAMRSYLLIVSKDVEYKQVIGSMQRGELPKGTYKQEAFKDVQVEELGEYIEWLYEAMVKLTIFNSSELSFLRDAVDRMDVDDKQEEIMREELSEYFTNLLRGKIK